ncbi:hypothetical protein T484DRAFT_1789160 [Baffinella frigidus]|nr:hypothetical protein T484DRAFT_1789160 [Cryptophyta sp. CCMP2293]
MRALRHSVASGELTEVLSDATNTSLTASLTPLSRHPGALRHSVASGELTEVLSKATNTSLTASLASAVAFSPPSTLDADPDTGAASGGAVGVGVVVYLIIGAGVDVWGVRRMGVGVVVYLILGAGVDIWGVWRNPAAQRSPHVAKLLWLLFGIMGAHRFYLKHPKVGVIYLCTLGGFGIGWLADLYLLRRLLFSSEPSGSRREAAKDVVRQLRQGGKATASMFAEKVQANRTARHQKALQQAYA